MSQPAPHRDLVIAVPTYRRNDLLEALLPKLLDQLDDVADLIGRPRILVADNDPDGGARPVIDACRSANNSVLVDDVHVSIPGVSACRNACLAAAAPGELLVFIDDDQTPRPAWLRLLLLARERTGADVIAAPARPVYTMPVAPWIEHGPFHDTSHLPRDTRMSLSMVTNCLFDVDVVRAHALEFPDIGTRGGEDSWFTTELVRRGAQITWEPDAIVDEPVPRARTRARWVLTRSFGNGIIAGRLGVRGGGTDPRLSARVRGTGAGVTRVVGGLLRIGLGTAQRDPAKLGGGLHTFARGMGMTVGAWDVVFDEYARDGSRWHIDRNAQF